MSGCQTFGSAKLYIDSVTTTEARLTKVIQIIDGLTDLAVTAASNDDIGEYSLNDGQVVIKTVYRSVDDIADSIFKWERVKNILLGRLNGRVVVLKDARTIRR